MGIAKQMMLETDYGELLMECELGIDNGPKEGYLFTEWEKDFIASLREQVDDGAELSQDQRAKLEQIYEDRVIGKVWV